MCNTNKRRYLWKRKRSCKYYHLSRIWTFTLRPIFVWANELQGVLNFRRRNGNVICTWFRWYSFEYIANHQIYFGNLFRLQTKYSKQEILTNVPNPITLQTLHLMGSNPCFRSSFNFYLNMYLAFEHPLLYIPRV